MPYQSAEIAQVNMELDIAAPVERVWKALTSEIGTWWPAEFYAGGEDGARRFELESWPGGRMFEAWDKGGGVLWGTVVCIEPEAILQVLGTTFPNWGGPSQWFGTWELTSIDSGTRLKFSESTLGRVSDAGVAEKDKGWQFLWKTLKAHLEGQPPPAWSDQEQA